jgi:NADP-dependent alcohol dehydrogenase
MNSGSVISRRATKQKLAMGGPGLFPVFSVLDPEVIRSIPKNKLPTELQMHTRTFWSNI